MSTARTTAVWAALTTALVVPIAAATMSPQLAWRDETYIVAGFAGVIALALLLLQPLLAGGRLAGLPARRGRIIHRWIGGALVLAVVVHVVGLWITSPPDVIDALLFASPTAFSVWGVIAMWAVFIAAVLAGLRFRLGLRLATWRVVHTVLAVITVVGTVVHAMLIEGTMETWSKAALCGLVVLAMAKTVLELRQRRS